MSFVPYLVFFVYKYFKVNLNRLMQGEEDKTTDDYKTNALLLHASLTVFTQLNAVVFINFLVFPMFIRGRRLFQNHIS